MLWFIISKVVMIYWMIRVPWLLRHFFCFKALLKYVLLFSTPCSGQVVLSKSILVEHYGRLNTMWKLWIQFYRRQFLQKEFFYLQTCLRFQKAKHLPVKHSYTTTLHNLWPVPGATGKISGDLFLLSAGN